MERRYFNLDRGYLNVNEHAIIFTRSGNWAEAEACTELVKSTRAKHAGRTLIGVVLMLTFLAMHLFHAGSDAMKWVIAGAALVMGGSRLLEPFTSEMGRSFLIPNNKVRSLTYDSGSLTIAFLDGNWKEDLVSVKLPADAATWIIATREAAKA